MHSMSKGAAMIQKAVQGGISIIQSEFEQLMCLAILHKRDLGLSTKTTATNILFHAQIKLEFAFGYALSTIFEIPRVNRQISEFEKELRVAAQGVKGLSEKFDKQVEIILQICTATKFYFDSLKAVER